MRSRIRVLVVDDSVIARRFITTRLEKDPEIEVVGAASSGTAGLTHIRRDPPDVVVLDEEMPDLRGRDVLRVIRKEHPTVAVVMFSARVGQGTQARFEALLLGADDAVAKPTSAHGPVGDDHPTWTELLSKAKAAARRPTRGGVDVEVARKEPSTPASPAPPQTPSRRSSTRSGSSVESRDASRSRTRDAARRRTSSSSTQPSGRGNRRGATRRPSASSGDRGVCVIASSTGGPDALSVVFESLGSDFPLPILVAQHMPPHFTKLLADRIDGRSALSVAEAQGGEPIVAGTAYIAPGDHHLVVDSRRAGCVTALDLGPPENSCRPAADTLFRSAVEAYSGRIVACVISGMGHDGLAGAQLIHEAGGTVIAQDEETSVVWGMPGAVVDAGIADVVRPLSGLADELTRAARRVAAGTTRAHRTGAMT